jgi:hypothetical protein
LVSKNGRGFPAVFTDFVSRLTHGIRVRVILSHSVLTNKFVDCCEPHKGSRNCLSSHWPGKSTMPQFRRAVYGDFLQAVWPQEEEVFRNLDELGYEDLVKLGNRIAFELTYERRPFPERESTILEMRFGLKDGRRQTFADIGRRLLLTGAQVSDLQIRALGRVATYGLLSLYIYCKYRSLFSRYPEMLWEWKDLGRSMPKGFPNPAEITVDSTRILNWKSRRNKDHEWRATPRTPTRKDNPKNCPVCPGETEATSTAR